MSVSRSALTLDLAKTKASVSCNKAHASLQLLSPIDQKKPLQQPQHSSISFLVQLLLLLLQHLILLCFHLRLHRFLSNKAMDSIPDQSQAMQDPCFDRPQPSQVLLHPGH